MFKSNFNCFHNTPVTGNKAIGWRVTAPWVWWFFILLDGGSFLNYIDMKKKEKVIICRCTRICRSQKEFENHITSQECQYWKKDMIDILKTMFKRYNDDELIALENSCREKIHDINIYRIQVLHSKNKDINLDEIINKN